MGDVLISSEAILGLPGYQITAIEEKDGRVKLSARYTGPIACPYCGSDRLRSKGRRTRSPRHESWASGTRSLNWKAGNGAAGNAAAASGSASRAFCRANAPPSRFAAVWR
ncbi:MAG: transposase family protein [Rhodospirillales bacterium]